MGLIRAALSNQVGTQGCPLPSSPPAGVLCSKARLYLLVKQPSWQDKWSPLPSISPPSHTRWREDTVGFALVLCTQELRFQLTESAFLEHFHQDSLLTAPTAEHSTHSGAHFLHDQGEAGGKGEASRCSGCRLPSASGQPF